METNEEHDMPFRICKILEIENAHMLSKHPDACKYPHGHSRRIEFVMESDQLDQNEMVCDFKVIKAATEKFVNRFDHAMCVNTEDPSYVMLKKAYKERIIPFEGMDPTTEVLARRILEECQRLLDEYSKQKENRYPLHSSVRLTKVRVWETSSSWAEYEV
jgi:6-pyruvoyltetrahydropterin/6-carboxytetrahydropterin synthase